MNASKSLPNFDAKMPSKFGSKSRQKAVNLTEPPRARQKARQKPVKKPAKKPVQNPDKKSTKHHCHQNAPAKSPPRFKFCQKARQRPAKKPPRSQFGPKTRAPKARICLIMMLAASRSYEPNSELPRRTSGLGENTAKPLPSKV